MAGGPYTDKNGSKYIIWSGKRLHPDQPKLREQLKTKKIAEAQRRKLRLEELYDIGKHKPWQQKWYDNPSIKPFIIDSLVSGDIASITHHRSVSLLQASEEYIAHQINRPKGWASPRTQKVYSDNIRRYVDLIGPERSVDSISEKDLYKVVFRPGVTSDETSKSDRSKLIAMFNYFKSQGWTDTVPTIEAPEPQQKVPKFFFEEQLLSVCWYKIALTELAMKSSYVNDQHQLRFVYAWMFLAGCGARPDEAVQIRLQDVYADQVLIGATSRGKTNSQRMIPILYEASRVIPLLLDPVFRKLDPALDKSDLLLGINSDMVKKRMSSELRKSWKAIYPKQGKRTAYNLRDFFAVRFLSDHSQGNQDFRLLQLRNALGHRSITTTEKYLKAVPSRLDLKLPKGLDLVKLLSAISSKVTK